MKKLILFTSLFTFFAFFAKAENASDLFSYDENKVKTELSELSQLESFVLQNEGITLSEINENRLINSSLYNFSITSIYKPDQTFAPGGIPSFWWAFVLCSVGAYTLYGLAVVPIAIAVVYLSTSGDMNETKKALWGSLVGTALGLAVWYYKWN